MLDRVWAGGFKPARSLRFSGQAAVARDRPQINVGVTSGGSRRRGFACARFTMDRGAFSGASARHTLLSRSLGS